MLLIIALGPPICVVFVTPIFAPDIFDILEGKDEGIADVEEFIEGDEFREFVALVDDPDV